MLLLVLLHPLHRGSGAGSWPRTPGRFRAVQILLGTLFRKQRRRVSVPFGQWEDIPQPEWFEEMTFTQEFTKNLFAALQNHGLGHLSELAENMSTLGSCHGDVITVRLGTVCSGSELLSTCLPHLCECFRAATGVTLRIDHRWACELDERKRAWIAANFPSLPAI